MSPQYSCDPALELHGHSTAALTRSLYQNRYYPILKKHGLDHIDEQNWYPLQNILNVLSEISETGSGTMDLVSIGVAAGENSILPDAVLAQPAPDFLKTYAEVFRQRHRGGDPGWICIEELDTQNIHIHSDTPYPDDLFYGLMYGLLQRVVRGQRYFLEYAARKGQESPHTTLLLELS